MKKLKKLLVSITFAFTLLLVLPAIIPNYSNTIEVQAAQQTQKSLTIFKGNRFAVSPTIGTAKQWKWSSSNSSVATVTYDSSLGKYAIKAVGYGKATIKGYYGSNTIYYYITVAKLSKAEVGLYKGNTYTLSITGSLKAVTWSSDNTSVATVNSNGKITAKKAGTANIKAVAYSSIGSKTIKNTFTCKVTVKNKTTSVQTYLTTLKNKISKSSLVNSKGNHYIKYKKTANTVTHTYYVIYDKTNDRLQFSYKCKDSASTKAVNISFYVYNTSKTYKIAPVITVTTPKGIKFKTTTSLDRRNLTKSTKLTFSIKSSNVKLTDSVKTSMQDISNSYLQSALKGWNTLVKNKTGLQLKNLGFTQYK